MNEDEKKVWTEYHASRLISCDAVFLKCEYCPIDCPAFEGEYSIHIHDDDVPF